MRTMLDVILGALVLRGGRPSENGAGDPGS
jgi:hypothetical protein